MIESAEDLKLARKQLGLSVFALAEALRLSAGGGAHVREMESGARRITGPVAVAVEAMLAGFRPEGWE